MIFFMQSSPFMHLFSAILDLTKILFLGESNAEHSGDLGMATKEPWKGRPAAIGRVLLRLVKGLFTLGFYWAPNAECQLPILCAILTHCARNQATE